MSSRSGVLLLGDEPKFAARQASLLFAVSGLLSVLGSFAGPAQARGLIWIGLADLATALVGWLLPWNSWGRLSPLTLMVPALGLFALSTWGFSGFAAGSGPFLVLMLAWVGLHYSARVVLAFTSAAAIAYLVPLAYHRPWPVAEEPPVILVGGVVLVGTGLVIAGLITSQVALQRRTLAQAREMDQWRAALMDALAHDVRLPITSVLFALEMLEDDPDGLSPQQRQELIGTALRHTVRIQRLADGLLDVERLSDQGRLRLDLTDVPLRAAIDSAAGFLSAGGLVVDVDPALMVRADPARLEQILVNLIGNAVRHGRPPVIITARAVDDSVRLEIRDHGGGVPEELRERLFDRFSGSYEAAGSVGLGLWITRRLVVAHEGEIHYEPADPGARFVLTLRRGTDLPAAHEPPGVAGTGRADRGAETGKGDHAGAAGQKRPAHRARHGRHRNQS